MSRSQLVALLFLILLALLIWAVIRSHGQPPPNFFPPTPANAGQW